jgi:hypothetical protein
MPDIMFIADEFDLSNSCSRVNSMMDLKIFKNQRWPSPEPHYEEFPKLGQKYSDSLIVTEKSNIITFKKTRNSQGGHDWVFDPAKNINWIVLSPGGHFHDGKNSVRVIGHISYFKLPKPHDSFASMFKKLFLKGYKPLKTNLKFGPSAARTCANDMISN